MDDSQNHISTVRQHLLDQLQALRNAPVGEALKQELDRSKGVAELARELVASAKVEVDYVNAVKGAAESPFLQAPDTPALPAPPRQQTPLPSASEEASGQPPRRDSLTSGPATDHPWRGSTTVHRLRG